MPALGCKLEVSHRRMRWRWWTHSWYWRGAIFDMNFGVDPVLVIDWQGPFDDQQIARDDAEAAATARVHAYAREVYGVENLPEARRGLVETQGDTQP